MLLGSCKELALLRPTQEYVMHDACRSLQQQHQCMDRLAKSQLPPWIIISRVVSLC